MHKESRIAQTFFEKAKRKHNTYFHDFLYIYLSKKCGIDVMIEK